MEPLDRPLADVARWLQERGGEAERDLAELVEINSFTDHKVGGDAVGARLDALFDLPGIARQHVQSTRYADHRVYRTAPPGKRGAPIALIGHHDTVFPPGKFEGYRVDGARRRGPGVLDMKGGLVVVAYALRALEAVVGLHNVAPICVASVGDEEVGSPEGQGVLRNAVTGAASALVFEAGRSADAIVTRRKGTGGLTIRVTGRAAHAGADHKSGVNALWALAKFVDGAQKQTDYARGVTVNVGRIEGGIGKNTVPGDALALVDIRFCSATDGLALVAALTTLARTVEDELPGATITLEGGILRFPMEKTEASAALFDRYVVAAGAAGLGTGESGLVGGGSDACTTAALGIASIDGLGPRGRGFHTEDEQIEVASLLPKAEALARFLLAETNR